MAVIEKKLRVGFWGYYFVGKSCYYAKGDPEVEEDEGVEEAVDELAVDDESDEDCGEGEAEHAGEGVFVF